MQWQKQTHHFPLCVDVLRSSMRSLPQLILIVLTCRWCLHMPWFQPFRIIQMILQLSTRNQCELVLHCRGCISAGLRRTNVSPAPRTWRVHDSQQSTNKQKNAQDYYIWVLTHQRLIRICPLLLRTITNYENTELHAVLSLDSGDRQ